MPSVDYYCTTSVGAKLALDFVAIAQAPRFISLIQVMALFYTVLHFSCSDLTSAYTAEHSE